MFEIGDIVELDLYIDSSILKRGNPYKVVDVFRTFLKLETMGGISMVFNTTFSSGGIVVEGYCTSSGLKLATPLTLLKWRSKNG